jgi:hypothetical protein
LEALNLTFIALVAQGRFSLRGGSCASGAPSSKRARNDAGGKKAAKVCNFLEKFE